MLCSCYVVEVTCYVVEVLKTDLIVKFGVVKFNQAVKSLHRSIPSFHIPRAFKSHMKFAFFDSCFIYRMQAAGLSELGFNLKLC